MSMRVSQTRILVRGLQIAVVVCAALVAPVRDPISLGIPKALAVDNCQYDTRPKFDGSWAVDGSPGITGARAWITTGDGLYCSGPASGTNEIGAWSMVAAASSKGWAQAGYFKQQCCWGDQMKYFYEYWDGGKDDVQEEFGNAAQNQNHEYWEYFDPTCQGTGGGCIFMRVDNTYEATSNFNPWGTWQGPWEPQFFGEVHDTGDDMPGTSSAKVHFTYQGVDTDYNYQGNYKTDSYVGGQNDNSNFWGNSTVTAHIAYDIWTIHP